MRGNHRGPPGAGQPDRSIPACAGEPYRRVSWSISERVYPRVCGGTTMIDPMRITCPGLSPRVRGNPFPSLAVGRRARSIPACAGEPVTCLPTKATYSVYPRVCGGTFATIRGRAGLIGLSPRVRGNPGEGGGFVRLPRSIPACAGEPMTGWSWFWQSGVYPRVCGGTPLVRITATPPAGLSPRVRGNRHRRSSSRRGPGSIPACAGEPWTRPA